MSSSCEVHGCRYPSLNRLVSGVEQPYDTGFTPCTIRLCEEQSDEAISFYPPSLFQRHTGESRYPSSILTIVGSVSQTDRFHTSCQRRLHGRVPFRVCSHPAKDMDVREQGGRYPSFLSLSSSGSVCRPVPLNRP